MSMDCADIPDSLEDVSDIELMMGCLSFKATTNNVGDTIQVVFHFSEPLPQNVECWKWDPVNGWYDHSGNIVSISADRMSITMEYEDGGLGDLDLLANAVVIDPAGFGAVPAGGGGGAVGGGGGGGGGGCFITSAKDTLPESGKILALILLLGLGIIFLLGFKRSQF